MAFVHVNNKNYAGYGLDAECYGVSPSGDTTCLMDDAKHMPHFNAIVRALRNSNSPQF